MTTNPPPPPTDETGSGDSLSEALRAAFESGRAIHIDFETTAAGETVHWTITDAPAEEPEPETAAVEPEPEYAPEPAPDVDDDDGVLRSGDDPAGDYFELGAFLTDPAAIAATAAAGAAVVNKIVGEVGATKRHRMSEETERLRIEAQKAPDPPAEEPGTDEA